MTRLAVLFAIFLLVAAPVAAQDVGIQNPTESTPTTLFFHLNAFQDFPINTQAPDDRYARGSTRGILAPTTTCTPDSAPGQVHQSHHTLYGFSTPGYVEYDFQENGGPRIHPEKGLAGDVLLDTSAGMTGTWFLKTTVDSGRFQGAVGTTNNAPVAVPSVVVEFTVRTGDDVSFGDVKYNEGQLIANGASEPQLLVPDSNVNPSYEQMDDGSHLYEFTVPLDIVMDTIPKDESYNVRVDVRLDIPGCDSDNDSAFTPGTVELFTDADHRPRLDTAILNPLELLYIHPQFVGNDLYIHTSFNSPWGNYDVDETPGGIEVSVEGPTEARSLVRSAFTQRHHEHDHHFEPVDVTYVWPYKLDAAQSAEYTVRVSAQNDQGTAVATGTASVDLGKQLAIDTEGNEVERIAAPGEKNTPALGPLAVLGLLAVALLRRR